MVPRPDSEVGLFDFQWFWMILVRFEMEFPASGRFWELRRDSGALRRDLGEQRDPRHANRPAAWPFHTFSRPFGGVRILAQHLAVPLMDPDPLLAEGKPTQPLPSSSAMRPADLWEDSVRMEAGFRKYVHRDVDHKRLLEKKRKEKEKLSEGYVPGAPEEVKVEKEESKEPEHVYEIYAAGL